MCTTCKYLEMICLLVHLIKNYNEGAKTTPKATRFHGRKTKTNHKNQGEVNAKAGSELSLFSGNYHEQRGPYGVNLASAKAKIRHVFCFKNMAAKVTEIGGASPPGIII